VRAQREHEHRERARRRPRARRAAGRRERASGRTRTVRTPRRAVPRGPGHGRTASSSSGARGEVERPCATPTGTPSCAHAADEHRIERAARGACAGRSGRATPRSRDAPRCAGRAHRSSAACPSSHTGRPRPATSCTVAINRKAAASALPRALRAPARVMARSLSHSRARCAHRRDTIPAC
jgi:hypothetical protein